MQPSWGRGAHTGKSIDKNKTRSENLREDLEFLRARVMAKKYLIELQRQGIKSVRELRIRKQEHSSNILKFILANYQNTRAANYARRLLKKVID